MKVKIFFNNNEESLQQEINDWFIENGPISITEILQSGTEGWTTISIFYLDNN